MTKVVNIKTMARALTVSSIFALGAAQGQSITKCQDADGNWHYGDFAAEACAEDATVTEIDQRGVKINETDAPPTQEELEAQRASEAARKEEAERLARQEREDERLLQTYDSVEAIVRARDERIEAVDRNLESHRLFREDLVEEKQALEENGGNSERIADLNQQIQQYDRAIANLKAEHDSIVEQFDEELRRYRELTGE